MLERIFGPEIRPPMKPEPRVADPEVIRSWNSIEDQYRAIYSYYEKLPSKGYEISEAPNGNLTIRTDHNSLHLSSLLPVPGKYNFIPADNFGVYLDKNRILYRQESLGARTFMFSLLHEFGHVEYDRQKTNDKTDGFSGLDNIIYEVYALTRILQDVAEYSRQVQDNESEAQFDIYQWRPNYQLRRMAAWKAQKERFAWAWALDKARNLERRGFPVITSFGTTNDLRLYVSTCLASHELVHADRLGRKTGGNTRSELTYNFLRRNRLEQVLNTRIEKSAT